MPLSPFVILGHGEECPGNSSFRIRTSFPHFNDRHDTFLEEIRVLQQGRNGHMCRIGLVTKEGNQTHNTRVQGSESQCKAYIVGSWASTAFKKPQGPRKNV
jgi:hypothetical protein